MPMRASSLSWKRGSPSGRTSKGSFHASRRAKTGEKPTGTGVGIVRLPRRMPVTSRLRQGVKSCFLSFLSHLKLAGSV